MRRAFPALSPTLVLLCAFHGGGFGACAHVGGLGHLGGVHLPAGGAHVALPSHAVSPIGATPSLHVAPSAAMASSVSPSPSLARVGGGTHLLPRALAIGADGLEIAADSAELATSGSPLEPTAGSLCHSFEDCGDGSTGEGALCDRTLQGADPSAVGVCRDACRGDADCPAFQQCRFQLDPDGLGWGGCVP